MKLDAADGRSVTLVIPVFNEELSLPAIHESVTKVMGESGRPYEIIFVNDGSSDASADTVAALGALDPHVRLADLSRNFGKEIALTAGLKLARGSAVIMLDADGQHPPSVIPQFLAAWDAGAEVVVGVRSGGSGQTAMKRLASRGYYTVLNSIAETKVVPSSTDFRLLDRTVVDEFNKFTERNRITRGLVDWLGFKREYVYFVADVRAAGGATYSFRKLIRLALDSFVSTSLLPLKVAGYLGIFITVVAAVSGMIVALDKYVFGDPLGGDFTSAGIITIFVVFLVGIILSCLGLIALYIANIHVEVINRPLFVARAERVNAPDGQPLRRSSLREPASTRDALRRVRAEIGPE